MCNHDGQKTKKKINPERNNDVRRNPHKKLEGINMKRKKYENILKVLGRSRSRDGLHIKTIAQRANIKENVARAYLSRLTKEGKIEHPRMSMYRRRGIE